MGFQDSKSATESERFWWNHELTRLGAKERAGFNVAKERKAIMRELATLDAREKVP